MNHFKSRDLRVYLNPDTLKDSFDNGMPCLIPSNDLNRNYQTWNMACPENTCPVPSGVPVPPVILPEPATVIAPPECTSPSTPNNAYLNLTHGSLDHLLEFIDLKKSILTLEEA